MAKKNIGAHPTVSPIPAFMVSCADKEGNSDIITISYGGIVSANPPWCTFPSVTPVIPIPC